MYSISINRIIVFLATLLLLILPIIGRMFAQNIQGNDFILYSYSYKSSANEPYIYPGSKYVELSIDVINTNNKRLYVYGACITLPQGFTISRGYTSCSAARNPNGSTIYIVDPGGVVSFRYYIDVSKDVVPGYYSLSINIRYNDDVNVYEQTIDRITIAISSYPSPSIEVINWYWSPDAYPGSENIYLYIVLRNSGNVDIVEGYGSIELPAQVFRPSRRTITLNNLNRDMSASISVGPLSIYSYADQGPYKARLNLNATMRTPDGVFYGSTIMIEFQVTLSPSPYTYITVVDYGFADTKVFQGSTRTRFYVTILNQDFATIRSIVAYFTLTSCGTFINNSRQSVYILETPLNYGATATLYSDYINIDYRCRYIELSLSLNIFGDINGAEFWSTQRYTFSIPLEIPTININVVETYWSGSYAYPGTKDANLVIVLENLDVVNVRNAIVKLDLDPKIFYPSTLVLSNIDIASGSRSTLIFRSISVSTQASPGLYVAYVMVSGIATTPIGSFFRTNLTLRTLIEIKKPESENIVEIVRYSWSTGKAYVSMVNTGIHVDIRVCNPFYMVENPVAILHLPPGFVSRDSNRKITISLTGRYSYGQVIPIQFQGIDIMVTEAGLYPIILELNTLVIDSSDSEFWFNKTMTFMMYVHKSSLNITIIDSGWISDIVTSSTYGASVYVTLQSYSIDTITSITASLGVDPRVAIALGKNGVVSYTSRIINYGDIVTLTFDGIDIICRDCVDVDMYVNISVVKSIGSSYYTARDSYRFKLRLVKELSSFKVVSLNTYYSGNPAPILPSARNLYISIDIANVRPYDISWIKPEIIHITSNMIRINSIGGSCLSGVARGGVCTLALNIDVDERIQPGKHTIILNLTYALYIRNTVIVSSEIIDIPLAVADYSYYRPYIRPSTWYWGIQTPIRALPGQRNVPLTIVFINNGRYRVDDVEVQVTSLTNFATAIINRSLCAATLLPTAYCSVTFYIDLAESVNESIPFDVVIQYVFSEYGTHIVDRDLYTIYMNVDIFAGGRGLNLVDHYWINNWPVYPATENATYVVRLYNSWPYRVSSISAKLLLPKGFSSRGLPYAYSYVSGPIQSFQQVDLSFTISIDEEIKPGRYWAKLAVEYIVESGLPYMRVEDVFYIYLQVNDISSSVSLLFIQWLDSVPEPRTYGAILGIGIRNNYVPVMRGPVLEVYTPSNILCSDTNTSYTSVIATRVSPDMIRSMTLASTLRLQYGSLQEYISRLIKEYTNVEQYSYGDILYFYLKLNLLVDAPGTYIARGYVNFIDQWNNVRKIPIDIPIHVIGSIKVIDITVLQPIKIKNGSATITIGLMNIGSAPIYNVYVYLIPQTPLLIPSGGLRYVDTLRPNITEYISFQLVYNPMALFSGTAMQAVRYTTAVFMLTILYRDASGYIRYVNTSVASLIEPFIDLEIVNIKASGVGNTLTVSGTIVNYGLATARNVEVAVLEESRVLGRSFLGDLDPASQYAFRVEASVDRPISPLILRISYRDEYGISRYVELPIAVSYEQRSVASTARVNQEQIPLMTHYIIITLVALFLASIGLILYRYVRKHIHKLSERIEV
ncbi:MAG: hypothetical protein QXW24_02650 [Ignisphaera sp.]